MLDVAAYFALFLSVGAIFVFANMLVGRLLRPSNPHVEKTEVYECGEPTIGSSFVQFDLRFYVVGLLFIIFEVEVAFFFPWAIVAGKANLLRDSTTPIVATDDRGAARLTPEASGVLRELGIRDLALDGSEAPNASPEEWERRIRDGAGSLAWIAAADIALFFAVLAVGFAYVWKRGDLDWVRAKPREFARDLPNRPDAVADADALEPIGGRTRRFSESL